MRKLIFFLLPFSVVLGCRNNIKPVTEESEVHVEETDKDGDGYLLEEDCDDNNGSVHPDAEELDGDGIDSNCDGEDDSQ